MADIATATSSDLQALLDLVHRAYRGDAARAGWTHEADLLDGQRTDLESLLAILSDPAQVILLYRHGDRLIGCVQVSDRGAGMTYLGMLSVDPECQANGVGRRLIEAAERLAASRFKASIMEMTVIAQRAELIAYYERRGYALTGERRAFPLEDPRFGLPKRADLEFEVLSKRLAES